MSIRMIAEQRNGFSCPRGTHFLSSRILKGNWCYIMFSQWLSALSQQWSRSRAKETENNRSRSMRAMLTAQQIHSHIHFLRFSSKLHNKTGSLVCTLLCVCGSRVCAVCARSPEVRPFFHGPPLDVLWQGVLLKLKPINLVRLAGQWPSGVHPSPLSKGRGDRHLLPFWIFYLSSRESKLRSWCLGSRHA